MKSILLVRGFDTQLFGLLELLRRDRGGGGPGGPAPPNNFPVID